MKLILDTHSFLWSVSEPERLPPRVRETCEDLANDVLLSVVSIVEIQIKLDTGKLELDWPLRELVEERERANPFRVLPLLPTHVYALADLPRIHKDPFDRLLVAQAVAEDASLVSRDEVIAEYPVEVLW